MTHTPTQTAQGAHGRSGQDSLGEYPHSVQTARIGHKMAPKSFRGKLGVKRPQVQVLSLGPKCVDEKDAHEKSALRCGFFVSYYLFCANIGNKFTAFTKTEGVIPKLRKKDAKTALQLCFSVVIMVDLTRTLKHSILEGPSKELVSTVLPSPAVQE